MRILPQLCALTVISFSLGGCSCSDKNSNTGAGNGGGGDGGTGGMVAAGGTGGDMGGTGGTPVTGGTGGMPAVGGGGTGGMPAVGGGGTGGTGGTPPVVPTYCEMQDAAVVAALPLTIDESNVVFFNQIGATEANMDYVKIANPNCDEVYSGVSVADAGDAGDGAVSDASTPVVDASVPPSDASVSDASVSDASTMMDGAVDASPMDGGTSGDGSVPAAACIGFHFTPTEGWSGVVFQANNNPMKIATASGGMCIAPGATKVTFEARADRATQMKFGEIWEGVEAWFNINTTWQPFTVPIPVNYQDYNSDPTASAMPGGVWKLFSIVGVPAGNAEAPNGVGEAKVFVRNIQYQM